MNNTANKLETDDMVMEHGELAEVGDKQSNISDIGNSVVSQDGKIIYDDSLSKVNESSDNYLVSTGSEQNINTNVETIVDETTTIKTNINGNISQINDKTYYDMDDPEITFHFGGGEPVSPPGDNFVNDNFRNENIQNKSGYTGDCLSDEDMYGDADGVSGAASPSMVRVETASPSQVDIGIIANLMQNMQSEINTFMAGNKNDIFIEMANNREVTLNEIQVVQTEINSNIQSVESTLEVKMLQNAKNLQLEVKHLQTEISGVKQTIKSEVKQVEIGIQRDIEGIQGNMRSVEHKIHNMESNFHTVLEQHSEKTEDSINSILKQNRADLVDNARSLQDNLLQRQNEGLVEFKKQNETISAAVNAASDKLEVMSGNVIQVKEHFELLKNDVSQLREEMHQELRAQVTMVVQLNDTVAQHEIRISTLAQELQVTKEMLRLKEEESLRQVTELKRDIPGVVQELIDNRVKDLSSRVEVMEEKQINTDLRCDALEVEVVAVRAQGNELNNSMHLIGGKIDHIPATIVSAVTEAMHGCMTTEYFRGPLTPTPETEVKEMLDNEPPLPLPVNNLPSISSTPLLPDGFVTPKLPQNILTPEVASAPSSSGEDNKIFREIMKKSQRPSFSGDNIVAPLFLREVENFFDIMGLQNDMGKLRAFPTFLSGHPASWWLLVATSVNSWENGKELFLKHYFSEYERQKYKKEWYNLSYLDYNDLEQFVLKAFQLINIIKSTESEQKKCQMLAGKLPEPLVDYLLLKHFSNAEEFLNELKETMRLKNFDFTEYVKTIRANKQSLNINSNQNSGINTSLWTNRNMVNNNPPVQATNNVIQPSSSTPVVMNPNYRGNPKNYDPHYRSRYYNNSNQQNGAPSNGNYQNHNNGNRNNNHNNGYRNNDGGRGQGHSRGHGNGNQRGNGNRSNGRNSPTPTNPQPRNNQQLGVNNMGMAVPNFQSNSPPSTPMGSRPSSPNVTQYYFTFTPDMLESVLRQSNKNILTQQPAVSNNNNADAGADSDPANC